MKIIKFEKYLDGGTIKIISDSGTFFFDARFGSDTKGRLYNGYPEDPGSQIIENSENLERELLEALKLYKDDFYQSQIDYFLNSRKAF